MWGNKAVSALNLVAEVFNPLMEALVFLDHPFILNGFFNLELFY